MIWHIKELSQETYLSFSDDLKIKMNQQQFAFRAEQYEEIKTWLRENMSYPYRLESKTKNFHCIDKFYLIYYGYIF